jgi:hypothetical protein
MAVTGRFYRIALAATPLAAARLHLRGDEAIQQLRTLREGSWGGPRGEPSPTSLAFKTHKIKEDCK